MFLCLNITKVPQECHNGFLCFHVLSAFKIEIFMHFTAVMNSTYRSCRIDRNRRQPILLVAHNVHPPCQTPGPVKNGSSSSKQAVNMRYNAVKYSLWQDMTEFLFCRCKKGTFSSFKLKNKYSAHWLKRNTASAWLPIHAAPSMDAAVADSAPLSLRGTTAPLIGNRKQQAYGQNTLILVVYHNATPSFHGRPRAALHVPQATRSQCRVSIREHCTYMTILTRLSAIL